jgi:hypothetical protein
MSSVSQPIGQEPALRRFASAVQTIQRDERWSSHPRIPTLTVKRANNSLTTDDTDNTDRKNHFYHFVFIRAIRVIRG